MPPSAVYKPVSTMTSTEPIQKLSISAPPRFSFRSGSNVENTTPPAKMPTAILETTKVISETTERT